MLAICMNHRFKLIDSEIYKITQLNIKKLKYLKHNV